MRVVVVSGGFDPLHSGHIAYFKAAKALGPALGDVLVVALNSDAWLTRKKGRPFMPFEERAAIIKELECVDEVIAFNDDDDTACDALVQTLDKWQRSEVIFANGGDRNKDNIPEMSLRDPRLSFMFSVGGEDKKNSSSWILSNWDKPQTKRAWGKYRDLDANGHWKVKELSINAYAALSDQRHFSRSEHWHIVDGNLQMDLEFANGYKTSKVYKTGESIDIPRKTWHLATNIGSTPCKVIEVWMGDILSEEDIERRN